MGQTPGLARRLTHAFGSLSLGFAVLLAACAAPAAPNLPLTRIASLETFTPPPPSVTPSPSRTPSPTPTFTPRPTATASATPSQTPEPVIDFMAVGDVMLARSLGELARAQGPQAVFASLAPALSAAEVLVANLECVIATGGQPEPKAYTFRAPPEAAQALAAAGVDVVSLANNHALDYGWPALAEERDLLAGQGIASVGAGPDLAAARAPVFVARDGLRLAFLAYVDVPVETRTGFDTRAWRADADRPGLVWADLDTLQTEVAAARAQADVVIVLLHFGLEGRTEPSLAQRQQARAAIDAGAALVVGSHPHVLQPVEAYHGGLILYSLGNFVFDGYAGPENQSAIFMARLTARGVEAYNWLPVVIESGLPRPATADESNLILRRLAPPSE